MKLSIITPLTVAVAEEGVQAVRAEDASGAFGVLSGHADFLTSLTISVVDWKRADGSRHYCAVRRGLLSVSGGTDVAIATREAVPGDDLLKLQDVVLAQFRAERETERAEYIGATRLQLAAIRQIMRRLRPDGHDGMFT